MCIFLTVLVSIPQQHFNKVKLGIFSGESDLSCIIKEIKPKVIPPHFLNKKSFGFEAPNWRKLLGAVFAAHPKPVLGCPDNKQPSSSPGWHSEFVSFTSDSKRQGNSCAFNWPQCFSGNTSGTWSSNTFWRSSEEKHV